jgi:lipopolysaccharide export LptBFGC system permease protein LptF
MLRVQRALLAELLVVFLLTLAVATSVVFAGFMVYLVNETAGLATPFVFDLLGALLPVALSYSVPFAWLAATSMVVGRMQGDHEIMALRVTGLHVRALVWPVAAVSALLAVGLMAFNADVVPASQRSIKEGTDRFVPMFLNALKGVRRSLVLGEGRLSFDSYDPQEGSFRDVEIDLRDRVDGRLLQKLVFDRVRIARVPSPDDPEGKVEFSLAGGGNVIYAEGTEGPEMRAAQDGTLLQLGSLESVGASTFFNETFGRFRYQPRAKELGVSELLYAAERGGLPRADERSALGFVHQRLSLGASPFPLGLFSMAIALLLPPGGRRVRDFLACFVPALLLFFPLFLAGGSIGRAGLPIWVGYWLPNLVLGAGAAGLLAWAFRR